LLPYIFAPHFSVYNYYNGNSFYVKIGYRANGTARDNLLLVKEAERYDGDYKKAGNKNCCLPNVVE
jgi:hypothetical protein